MTGQADFFSQEYPAESLFDINVMKLSGLLDNIQISIVRKDGFPWDVPGNFYLIVVDHLLLFLFLSSFPLSVVIQLLPY
jgi:hypothetical protein